jgi:methenyltetrahydromethanopterin cyclohydrolase
MTLNDRAWAVADAMEKSAEQLRIMVQSVTGARMIDCGAAVDGSLEAGLMLARACMADLATVTLAPGELVPVVQVMTDHPVRSCLASQYAGWQVTVGNYFAMGSGPMRAAAAREPIFEQTLARELPSCAVGILETKQLPTDDVVAAIVAKLPTVAEKLTLLVAPTSSIAGTVQVVARSVETALHKLHELHFDLGQIVSGYGTAPLPPVAKETLTAIGRTNDAILYGGRVTLWVKCPDDVLDSLGPKVPSNASSSHGRLFADLLKAAGSDFYKLDPALFAPAEIMFVNLRTGSVRRFGVCAPELVRQSFGL